MRVLLGIALLIAAPGWAQTNDPWKPLEFLVGEWTGEGGGGPGQGGGGFSFQFDLNKTVMVRKNYAEHPAQNGREAFRHDDLMVVYLDESSKKPRAIYFDSEGHTIRYAITTSGSAVVFESEAGEPGAHYRLTMTPGGDRVKGKFEVKAPGEAQYQTYIDFAAKRKS